MPILPQFHPDDFSASTLVDNPYFPLGPGQIRAYRAETEPDEEGEITVETHDAFVTFETRNVAGVEAVVVRDTAYENGVLVEDTFDWYAQDDAGNVWYLGEQVYNYRYDDDGTYVSTDFAGSFEAGVDGAQGGYKMPAEPGYGAGYYQEFAPGIAVDWESSSAPARRP